MNYLHLEQKKGIATLSLVPSNGLNADSLRELLAALAELENDAALRALIFKGQEQDSLLADVSQIMKMSPFEALTFSRLGQQVCRAIEELHAPVIACIDGMALGGGCELVLACDLAYASDRSKFGQIEVQGGILPGFGGTWRLTRHVGVQRALRLILTGEVIEAAQAREFGILLDALPVAALAAHCEALARQIAAHPPLAVMQAKRVVNTASEMSLADANALERQAFALLFSTQDQKEAMRAFLEHRPAHFQAR